MYHTQHRVNILLKIVEGQRKTDEEVFFERRNGDPAGLAVFLGKRVADAAE